MGDLYKYEDKQVGFFSSGNMDKRLLLGSHIIICHITPPITSHSPKKINSNFPIVSLHFLSLDFHMLLLQFTQFLQVTVTMLSL